MHWRARHDATARDELVFLVAVTVMVVMALLGVIV
jgi:hypothetical protein